MSRDERMGPWRPLPQPRRAIWRYRLACAVAVMRDKLEVAGVFPFRRYFWAPFLETPEGIAEWERHEARAIAYRARVKALGPNASMNELFKAFYFDAAEAVAPMFAYESPLMRVVPTTPLQETPMSKLQRAADFLGAAYSEPIEFYSAANGDRIPVTIGRPDPFAHLIFTGNDK